MEQIAAIMMLVGCNADASACSEIPVPVPSYQTVAQCEAALPLQMRLTATYDKSILGICKGVEAALLEESATIEWAVNRGGELLVDIVPEEPVRTAELGASPASVAR